MENLTLSVKRAGAISQPATSEMDQLPALLDRCKNENRLAQVEVYKRFSKAMYNTALRIVGEQFDAEDVMQEAFLNAFQRLNELKDPAIFPAWLKRIVVNKSINRLQQRKTYLNFLYQYSDEPAAETPRDEVQFSIDLIKRKLDELPEGYRIILTLYLIEGYDHEEIAEILSISSATSRSQYNRGKKKLRELLNETL